MRAWIIYIGVQVEKDIIKGFSLTEQIQIGMNWWKDGEIILLLLFIISQPSTAFHCSAQPSDSVQIDIVSGSQQ